MANSAFSRIALAVAAVILLAGCDPFRAPESMLEEYVKRVGRVLDTPVELSTVTQPPQLPRRRDRIREMPDLNVNLLDFFGLYGCELQHVVGERNSSLGRVMHPLTALDYELRFIVAAEACAAEIERERIAERLLEVAEIKRDTLPDVAWNTVWGSREIEDFLTRSRGPLGIGHDRNMTSIAASDLRRLEALLMQVAEGQLEVDVTALDAVYQRWLNRPVAGQTLRSATLVTTRLNDASRLIEGRLDDRPLCHKGMRNRQADIMHNMFMSVYATHVQPYLAEVQRARRDLWPSLQRLVEIGDAGRTPDFAGYAAHALIEADDGLWAEFDQAIARHTRAWQGLLEQCGMRVGAPVDG